MISEQKENREFCIYQQAELRGVVIDDSLLLESGVTFYLSCKFKRYKPAGSLLFETSWKTAFIIKRDIYPYNNLKVPINVEPMPILVHKEPDICRQMTMLLLEIWGGLYVFDEQPSSLEDRYRIGFYGAFKTGVEVTNYLPAWDLRGFIYPNLV